jgi:hypothetical protein
MRCLETHRTAQSALSSAFMVKNLFEITRIAAGVSFPHFTVTGNFNLHMMLKIDINKSKYGLWTYIAHDGLLCLH